MDSFSWKNIMKYRNFLYGLMAVWIVFFHIHDMIRVPKDGALAGFLHLGNIGVDVFLFLSAVGLSYSIEKNSLKEFYKNRFLRLVVPFMIICIPYYMWRDSVTGITLERIGCFILDITAINFWLKEKVPFWYISLAIVLYALYPLFYKLYRKNKIYIALLIILWIPFEIILINRGVLVHSEKALSRVPVFLIGVYVSDYIKENRSINKKHIIMSVFIFITTFLIYYILDTQRYPIMYKRFTYAVMVIPMIIIITYVLEKLKAFRFTDSFVKFFTFFGTISLELYLVHNAITRILKYYDLRHFAPYTYYLWIFPVSVILSVIYNKISNKINHT